METKIKKNVNWKLPLTLIRAVKRHAADTDAFPSHIAERALSEFLDRQATRKRVAATAPVK